jgi:hypothetical protein
MGQWYDRGEISADFINEFQKEVKNSRYCGVRARLYYVFHELYEGFWGPTREDVVKILTKNFQYQLQGIILGSVKMIEDGLEKYLLDETAKEALKNDKVDLVVGKTPDGIRHVAFIIIDEKKSILREAFNKLFHS